MALRLLGQRALDDLFLLIGVVSAAPALGWWWKKLKDAASFFRDWFAG